MEISKLENIGNTQLFFILKFVNENHSYNEYSFDDIENSDFKENCDSACKIAGIGDIDFIDYNFILASLIINKNYDFTSSKPTSITELTVAVLPLSAVAVTVEFSLIVGTLIVPSNF